MAETMTKAKGTLSIRQREILELIVQGYTNREIAEMLHITEGTVKEHTTVLFDKLGVRTRAKAAAVSRGFL
jgi:DNA-binding NarL/FixJ family response regulator